MGDGNKENFTEDAAALEATVMDHHQLLKAGGDHESKSSLALRGHKESQPKPIVPQQPTAMFVITIDHRKNCKLHQRYNALLTKLEEE